MLVSVIFCKYKNMEYSFIREPKFLSQIDSYNILRKDNFLKFQSNDLVGCTFMFELKELTG